MKSQRDVVQGSGEVEITRRVVDRVAAEDQKYLHLPGIHVTDEQLDRLALEDRSSLDGLNVLDSVIDIAECPIGNVAERMDDCWLMVPGDQQCLPSPPLCRQVAGNSGGPSLLGIGQSRCILTLVGQDS